MKPEFEALAAITKAAELCAVASELQEQAVRLCLKAEEILTRAASIRANLSGGGAKKPL